jgi:serine/threonine protein kinase/tetratricopeptide (TPR) repeat protein
MTLVPGTRLGPYEILAPIGAGGMGEVYRARDTKLDRDVAIKVLPASVAADPDSLARFEREAKAVAALSHPNILAIHDFGTHEGISYAVTELLQGTTLREKLADGPVREKEALNYAVQLARGLSAAHEKGVVHRDLKPENLFVTRDGHLKILDFGLAKRIQRVANGEETNAPTESGHTQPGTVMGTVDYMSPEQVRGLPVDHRSDIFSFGTILYELLSGKKAFRRETPADTMSAVLNQEPPPLSSSGHRVAPIIEHVVSHCLEKDRYSRFQSAMDIAFALSAAAGSGPPQITGAWAPARPIAKRKSITLIVAILAALVAAAALFRNRAPRGEATRAATSRVAVLPFENLGAAEDDYFSDGITDSVRAKLTSLPSVQVIARGSSIPYKKTNKTPDQIARELGVVYLLTATVRWQKSGKASRVLVNPELVEIPSSGTPTSKWQQSFDAALTDVFQVQADIATRVARELGVALGANEAKRLGERPTENLAAYDAFLKGEEALESGDVGEFRKAVGFHEQAVALDPRFAQAWASLSIANSRLYAESHSTPDRKERAREAAQQAMALAPGGSEGPIALGTYKWLVEHDFNRALEYIDRGQRLDPGNAELLRARGANEVHLGRWRDALEHYRQAERLDPRSPWIKVYLAGALLRLHRDREAREVLDQGLDLAPDNLELLGFKAMWHLARGDLEGARAVFKSAPPEVEPTTLVAFTGRFWDLIWVLDEPQRELLLRLTPGAFDDDRSMWGLSLAQACALKGDPESARTFADEARKAAEYSWPSSGHARLGLALAYLGRREEAIREGKRAVDVSPVKTGWLGPYSQHQLVRIYILVGEQEKALDQLEPLLRVPYFLTPAWLTIDPNFDPLRGNPRFQKLVSGAKQLR